MQSNDRNDACNARISSTENASHEHGGRVEF